jgi:hypothetical protein
MKKVSIAVLCALCALWPKPASAEFSESQFEALQAQVQKLTGVVQDLKQTVAAQKAEIDVLKSSRETRVAETAPAMPAQASGPRTLQGRWNPDIGVIADTLLSLDSPKADEEGADRLSVRHLELVFGSAIDPYSRLDATLAISDFEEMEIEEAYMTRYELPMGLTARVGRFMPRIGKSIPLHLDSLDTVDEPMVIERYFGHHGYSKTGADVTRPIELPWAMTHQATFGVLEGGNGEEGTLFGEARRRPTVYGSLKNFLDIGDATGLEIGLSHLAGSRDGDGAFEVNVLGLDGTLIHRYADQRHVKLQAEAYHVNRSESSFEFEDPDTGVITEQDLDDARHLWGGYLLGDWRFHPQWATGVRFDDVQLIESGEDFANPQQTERGYTGYLTFYQSEFARWRLQYSHIDQTNADDDHRVFVQGTFAIGEHKHKLS